MTNGRVGGLDSRASSWWWGGPSPGCREHARERGARPKIALAAPECLGRSSPGAEADNHMHTWAKGDNGGGGSCGALVAAEGDELCFGPWGRGYRYPTSPATSGLWYNT